MILHTSLVRHGVSRREFFSMLTSPKGNLNPAKIDPHIEALVKHTPQVPLEAGIDNAKELWGLDYMAKQYIKNPVWNKEEKKQRIATEFGHRASGVLTWFFSALMNEKIYQHLPVRDKAKYNLWLSTHVFLTAQLDGKAMLFLRKDLQAILDERGLEWYQNLSPPNLVVLVVHLYLKNLNNIIPNNSDVKEIQQECLNIPNALHTRRGFFANTALLIQHSLPFPLPENKVLNGVLRLLASLHGDQYAGSKYVRQAEENDKKVVAQKIASNFYSYPLAEVVNALVNTFLNKTLPEDMFREPATQENFKEIISLLAGVVTFTSMETPLDWALLNNRKLNPFLKLAIKYMEPIQRVRNKNKSS